MYIKCINNSMFNNNIMINYIKNNKLINNLYNINKSNYNHSTKNEPNYFHFNNDYSKDIIHKRNRVNIFEEHSKLINSKKVLNIKKSQEELSSHNTFDKDTIHEKAMSLNYRNINNNMKNSRSHNHKKDLLNKIKINSLNENIKTITYENIFKKKEEKNQTSMNINLKKNNNKFTKYAKYKKEIFEKVSKNISEKLGKKHENLEIKKLKLNENKNSSIRVNIKSKSQLETENVEKIDSKNREKNKTEFNKIDNSENEEKDLKKEKIIKNNIIKNPEKENSKIKIVHINKKYIKIDKNDEQNQSIEKKSTNNEETNKNPMIKNENKKDSEDKINNLDEDKLIHNLEGNENGEESNNKFEENNIGEESNNKLEESKIGEQILECENLNMKSIKENEEDSDLSYFDITKIKNDNQIPKEYINKIYYNLLKEEEKDLIPKPIYEKIQSQKEINEQMRSILVDWIIDVHYKFGFTNETLFMTVLIIDRYISIKYISKIRFQLLGITAMLIACKHEEITLPKVDDFIYITDNAYTKEEVFIMENDILHVFNFELLFPSPIRFFEFLSLNFNFNKKQYLMGKYLMESFLIDLKWVNYRPSIISCACAYIIMKFYKMENYQETYNKKYYNSNENDYNSSKFNNEYDVKECAKDICNFVDNINKSNFLSCKKKYASEENEKISLIVEGQNP